MKNLNSILESVIDTTRKHLDPSIFDVQGSEYTMRSDVVTFLKDTINVIDRDIVNVDDNFIKGSILSFQWLDNTDIDVLIEVDPNISEDDRRRVQNEIDDEFSIDIPGTEHPLQIYIQPGKYDINSADGVYNLDNGWVKGPYNIAANISNYMDKFNKAIGSVDLVTGELKRSIIDYNILKKLPHDEVDNLSQKLEQKIAVINETVEAIVFQYKHIRNMRHDAFKEDMTPKDIAKYGTKNSLPENVIFKLMERYYYLKMMRDLKSLVEENDIDTDEEVEKVKDSIEQSQFGE